jgi:hypothetical protein
MGTHSESVTGTAGDVKRLIAFSRDDTTVGHADGQSVSLSKHTLTEKLTANVLGKAGNKFALSGRLLMKKRRLRDPGYEKKATHNHPV